MGVSTGGREEARRQAVGAGMGSWDREKLTRIFGSKNRRGKDGHDATATMTTTTMMRDASRASSSDGGGEDKSRRRTQDGDAARAASAAQP